MNAFKNSANLSRSLGTAQKYAKSVESAARIAAQMANVEGVSKLQSKLAEMQRLQSQIQQYKEALRAIPQAQAAFQKQLQKNSAAAAQKQAAAQQVANLKIQLAQMQAAQASLKRTSAEYKALQAQIKSAKAEIKSANDALKVADTVFKSSQNRTAEFGGNLSRQISQLNQLRSALSAAGVGLNQLGAAEMRLQSQINSTNSALQRQHELAARRVNFGMASENLSEKYSNFQNATATAQTIMNPFTDAAQNAMTYEYALTNVKALTQLKDIRAGNFEKVNSEMAAMDKTFRHLGATTEYTSTEVAQSAGYFAMAGWNAERIQAVLPAFINLATATQTKGYELARLADVFSDDMTAAGLKAGQMIKLRSGAEVESAQYFSDAFAYAVTNANLNRESLHESVKYFAPVAKQMGLDVSEMLATTMLTANAGIKGTQMGTAFRAGLIRMVAPTKAAQGALAEMGMTMSDAQKQYAESQAVLQEMGITGGTFTEKLSQMAQVFSTMSQEEKLSKLNAIVGRNALSAWAEIFENPEKVAQIAEYAKFMESPQIQGYATDTANVQRQSTQVQWELVKSSMDAVVNQVGTALLPSIVAISQSLAPILTQLAEWISKNPEIVQGLAAIAAAISTIIVAAAGIQLISAAWGMVTASASLASGAMARVATALAGVSFASIGAAISNIGTAFMAAARGAMAFIFTPIGAAVAVIAGLAYLIYENWDKVGPMFQAVADTLRNAFGKAVEYVSGLWDGLVEKFNKLKEFLHFDFGNDSPAKAAFDYSKNIPTYQSASLGNLQAPAVQTSQQVQTVQSVQTIDFQQVQSQIDNFGNAVQSQTYNFENFGTNLQNQSATLQSQSDNLSAIIAAADTSISQSANEVTNQAAAINQSAVEISNQTAAVTQNALEISNQTAAVTQNAAEVTNQTAAVQTSVPSIQNMAATADASTSSISNLANAANSAASSLSGLGAAVSSAISSIQIAGANAAASIPTGNVAKNANGGIYGGGAFLSWLCEKGGEAVIPLDGSTRAMNLWQATGKILGVEPQNNFAGNIFNSSGNSIFSSGGGIFSDIFNKIEFPIATSWNPNIKPPTFNLPNFNLPNFDILNQIGSAIFQPISDISNRISGAIFQPINDISNKIGSAIFQPINDIFNKINLPNLDFPNFNLPNLDFPNFDISGMILNEVGTFPALEFPETGTFPTLDLPERGGRGGDSFTFNFTINVTANNPQEFQAAIPQIEQSFEEQIENWLNERRRREFAW